MPKAPNEVLADLRNSLHDLESMRMTASDDPTLSSLKREIQKMINRAEEAATR
jgi:hypothetical protein